MNNDNFMLRQGDVLIVKVDDDSIDLSDKKTDKRDNNRVVLAYGEVTGHAHAIHEDNAFLFTVKDAPELFNKEVYLRVNDRAVNLVHEEHSTLSINPGTYKIIHQKEYTPESIRSVVD